MATHAPITGAPTRAPSNYDLDRDNLLNEALDIADAVLSSIINQLLFANLPAKESERLDHSRGTWLLTLLSERIDHIRKAVAELDRLDDEARRA